MVGRLLRRNRPYRQLEPAEVRVHGEGVKLIMHASMGPIELAYSAFAIDGRPDLSMIVYNPVSSEIASRIRSLIRARRARRAG